MNNSIILHCDNIYKTYQDGNLYVEVIHGLNLTVNYADSIGIVGSSGSGKSTLLQLMGGLDSLSSGKISILGKNIQQMSQTELGLWRNKHLGFIYQFHHLLPEFSALENVMMPLLISKLSVKQAKNQAAAILAKVGLQHRILHRPNELSGGEKQRVSIARAIATNPSCILADEPTGNLDKRNAENIIELMINLKKELNLAFVVVTHDEHLIKYFNKTYLMSDGKLTILT